MWERSLENHQWLAGAVKEEKAKRGQRARDTHCVLCSPLRGHVAVGRCARGSVRGHRDRMRGHWSGGVSR